ncbi:MAG: DMT family transporter [Alphaproteobacteria bacterium]|nr:DMT family transporter [Alphaproteobacteria bacterium]
MTDQRQPDIVVGVLLMAGAALIFAAMHALIRFAAAELHPFEIAFFRWFFGAIFLIPFIVRGRAAIWKTPHLKLHLSRAVMTAGATCVWFSALTLMPLAQATALSFTIPMFTTVGAALFLHEHVGLRRWTATLFGFFGVLIILRPGVADISAVSLLPIVAAVLVAYNLNVIKFTGRTDSTETVVVYNTVLSTPLTAIPMLFVWQTPSPSALAILALLGLLATVAHFLLTKAFTYGDASALVSVDYLRLPFIALIGFLFFAEIPDIWTWIGGAVIAGATIYIARREAKLARLREDVTDKAASKPAGTV